MIIVAGHLRVGTGDRERFLTLSREDIQLARTAPGCHDFVVATDPIDAERVNVYECWTDRAAMHAFRGGGPSDDLETLIVSADIGEFEVLPAPSL
ncbi:antibiotic biosynthesis monooxygenase [Dactylosporangium roseum]|uniref:Antibiotic biosynthesis monooxygenase n=1 Tax=Dactylosporangium roseum TaxID=47989 RepID=A0ABY5Z3G9_9ACTN|nr:antibiotic biosynthesis monooxygenase [Dactylosporangium roseum]UWZ36593.1 antibiotic biosynthesis monooxygenase [Dactylosporangium roseum]